jgi:hypothetical protein
MMEITDEQRAEYFHRSYAAADGLWFMKVEERYGFDVALEIDEEVWRVLPKIQARAIKSILNLGSGRDDLLQGIAARLALEGFEFEAEREEWGFRIAISRCPWHDLMIKSGRENLSEKVGSIICPTENAVWASEFGDMNFELESQICRGSEQCTLRFF